MTTPFLRAALAAALAATLALPAAAYDSLVVFGDSLSDNGNNRVVLGNAGSGQAVPDNTYVPSLPYASGTYSNGPVWATGVASGLGLTLAPSLQGGTDFAFGGARTGPATSGFPFSLLAQTGQFLGATGNRASPAGLYVLAGGGNNARDALALAAASPTALATIATAAAASYAADVGSMVDALQAAGAVDILVWNVPNLALAPAVLAGGLPARFVAATIATAMNQALAARLASEGSSVKTFDVYGFFDRAAGSFANTADACGAVAGADCSTYAFWDGIHPTTAAHAVLAREVLAQVTPIPEPETLALMAAGLAALGWRARRVRPAVRTAVAA